MQPAERLPHGAQVRRISWVVGLAGRRLDLWPPRTAARAGRPPF